MKYVGAKYVGAKYSIGGPEVVGLGGVYKACGGSIAAKYAGAKYDADTWGCLGLRCDTKAAKYAGAKYVGAKYDADAPDGRLVQGGASTARYLAAE